MNGRGPLSSWRPVEVAGDVRIARYCRVKPEMFWSATGCWQGLGSV